MLGKVGLSLPKRERPGGGGGRGEEGGGRGPHTHQLYIMAFHVIFCTDGPMGGGGPDGKSDHC
jgi:hypothetical protein